jgi:hypothetical protein
VIPDGFTNIMYGNISWTLWFTNIIRCLHFWDDNATEAYVQASVAAEEQRVAALCAELGITVLLGTTGQRGGQLHNDVLVLNERGKTLGRYSTQTSQGWPRV